MAKRNDDKPADFSQIGAVEPRSVEAEMEASYLDYSMSVIVARELTDVRVGLKIVISLIVLVMNMMGLIEFVM
ncbi:hypothetical protein HY441_00675, partial [Candidatus Microgenomates bacterium]|nr:hypothetical protein [Candidatus Microgenomates bacterium]